jgi:putative hydrolase of the HAD superfamily
LFRDDFIFGVEDVMPACKPEKEAFQTVLDAVGADAESSVMFEDSLKNIRACRALGMRCVFVEEEVGGEAALLGDSSVAGDDDLYVAKVRLIADLEEAAPWLWERKSS